MVYNMHFVILFTFLKQVAANRNKAQLIAQVCRIIFHTMAIIIVAENGIKYAGQYKTESATRAVILVY